MEVSLKGKDTQKEYLEIEVDSVRKEAICAIIDMDIQDVLKYLSYIKEGKI